VFVLFYLEGRAKAEKPSAGGATRNMLLLLALANAAPAF